MLVNTSDSKLYFRATNADDHLVAFYSCDAPEFYDSFYANAEGNGREDDATDGYKRFVAKAESFSATKIECIFHIYGLGSVYETSETVQPTMHITAARLEWSIVRAASMFRVSYRNAKLGWESVLV